jgi:hypothetical protein
MRWEARRELSYVEDAATKTGRWTTSETIRADAVVQLSSAGSTADQCNARAKRPSAQDLGGFFRTVFDQVLEDGAQHAVEVIRGRPAGPAVNRDFHDAQVVGHVEAAQHGQALEHDCNARPEHRHPLGALLYRDTIVNHRSPPSPCRTWTRAQSGIVVAVPAATTEHILDQQGFFALVPLELGWRAIAPHFLLLQQNLIEPPVINVVQHHGCLPFVW